MTEDKFFKSAIIYTVGSVFVQGLTFLTLPIFTKIMSPDDFGILASYNFWIAIMTIFIGIKLEGSLNNAVLEFGENKISGYSSSMILPAFVSFCLLLIITFVFQKFLVNLFMIPLIVLLIGCVQSLFTFFFTILITKYIAAKKPWKYLFWAILNASLNIVLSILFVSFLNQQKYLGRVYASVLTSLIVGIICCIILIKQGKEFINKKYLVFGLTLTIPLIFHSLSSIILARSDQIMLLNLVSEYDAGVYSYASNFGHILSVVFNSCNQALVPWYFIRLKSNDIASILNVTKQYMIIAIFLFIGFLCVLPEAVVVMGTVEYRDAIYSAPIIGLAFYFNYLYMFPVNFEFYHKKTNYISLGTVCAAVLNIILNFILIPKLGSIGAALATMLSYLILLVFHYIISKYYIKGYELSWHYFFVCSLLGFICLVIYYLLIPFQILRWIIAIIVGVSLCALFYLKSKI